MTEVAATVQEPEVQEAPQVEQTETTSPEEETPKVEEQKAEEAPKEETPVEVPKTDAEVRELRQMLREQKRTIDSMSSKLREQEQVLKDAKVIPEAGEEATAEQLKMQSAITLRQTQLETILETMKVNPKYEDVENVVSQARFDDTIEVMARDFITKNGGEFSEVVAQMEQYVWGSPNPYKFMYERIKAVHPDFTKGSKEVTTAAKITERTLESIKGQKVAPSVSNMGVSSDSLKGGWTASRIDSLPEDELGKVPRDIYDLYLQGKIK